MRGYSITTWEDILFNQFNTSLQFTSLFALMLLTFTVGCVGLAWRAENLLTILVYGELLLVSLVFGFVLVSKFWAVPVGQIYALAILNAAAVESAIGLVLILNIYKTTGSVAIRLLRCLRG